MVESDNSDKIVKQGNAEDAAYILKNADSVIIVPGYGMAVAQAQHALKEMGDLLKKENINVRYGDSSSSWKNARSYECTTC